MSWAASPVIRVMSSLTAAISSTPVVASSSVASVRGVGALIQRGGRAVAGMLTIATAGGS